MSERWITEKYETEQIMVSGIKYKFISVDGSYRPLSRVLLYATEKPRSEQSIVFIIELGAVVSYNTDTVSGT